MKSLASLILEEKYLIDELNRLKDALELYKCEKEKIRKTINSGTEDLYVLVSDYLKYRFAVNELLTEMVEKKIQLKSTRFEMKQYFKEILKKMRES